MTLIRKFLSLESAPGIILTAAACLALIVENSPLSYLYGTMLGVPITIQVGTWSLSKPILLWVNDGLMAVFFLLVALEIKREFLVGELSRLDQVLLPSVAAVGGIVFPALCYVLINWGDMFALKGWAIPVATDIAFALGVLSLLGKRAPKPLKVCLTTIAVLDDIGAIIIIALFYTASLSLLPLLFAVAAIAVLLFLNKAKVSRIGPYMITGVLLWACVLKSGVHATLAGALLGFFIPLKIKNAHGVSLLKHLEEGLYPWVAFGVLPLFAFANAGVPLCDLSLKTLSNPITLGITTGLIVGAPSGVMLFSVALIKSKLAKLPNGVSWSQYMGMSLLTGIGFTMSLFIGTLAFSGVANQNAVRIGVLFGSAVACLLGIVVLLVSTSGNNSRTH